MELTTIGSKDEPRTSENVDDDSGLVGIVSEFERVKLPSTTIRSPLVYFLALGKSTTYMYVSRSQYFKFQGLAGLGLALVRLLQPMIGRPQDGTKKRLPSEP